MFAVQCKMARAAIGLGVRELAERAKVSPDTIARLERGEPLRERTIDAIRAALESSGVEFTNGAQPGVKIVMAAFRLDPLLERIGDPSWTASTIKEVVWAGAHSQEAARRLVTKKSALAMPLRPGEIGLTSPWLNERLTSCIWDRAKFDVKLGTVATADGRIIGE